MKGDPIMGYHYHEMKKLIKRYPELRHTIIGIILVIIFFAIMMTLLIINMPEPPQINDRAPILEKVLEKIN